MSLEFEYWWLLILPLFFTLGWLAARIDIKQVVAESTKLPAAYFKGLNHLISEQPSKAAEAFADAIQIKKDSLDLHFALGSLFRRTGETDKAIHLHNHLLENKELSSAQKTAVNAELAQDYLKAGLYDRAEELFKSLYDTRYRQASLNALLEIYVREREWQEAITTATELERLSGIPFRKEIAQYYCERATNAVIAEDHASAKTLLEQALDANKDCVRANVMLGDMASAENDHQAAITYWKQIEFQNPQQLGLVAEKLLKSYQASRRGKAGLNEGIQQLKSYLEKYELAAVSNTLYEVILVEEGAEAAADFARETLKRNPSLKSLAHLLQARAISEDTHDVQLMQQTVRNAIGDRAAYYCDACGFRAKHYHWQCPACNAWESLPTEPSESLTRDIKLIKR